VLLGVRKVAAGAQVASIWACGDVWRSGCWWHLLLAQNV
jgi:hypothetical protein